MKKHLAATFILVLVLALGLTATALAADRGVLTYEQIIAPQYDAAQSFDEGLAAVQKDGKWGYIDTDNNVVIPFEYDRAYAFSEGYAVVVKFDKAVERTEYEWDNDTWERVPVGTYTQYVYHMGFIDKENNFTPFILPYAYDEETDESLENVPYFITSDYSPISNYVSNDYENIFFNGYITLWDPDAPEAYLYDTTGHTVELNSWLVPNAQVTEGTVRLTMPNSYMSGNSLYDLTTGESINIDYDFGDNYGCVYLAPMNQGIIPANPVYETYNEEDYWYDTVDLGWGFADRYGNWLIQPQYDDFMVSGLSSYEVFGVTGLAMAKNADGYWGAIDKTGKTVIPFQYEQLWPYRFGLAAFNQGGKYGYIDDKTNVVIPAQYQLATGFSSSGYAVVYDGSKAFLIDTKGSAIPGADNMNTDTYFRWDSGDLPVVYTPGEYVVIQENGKYGFGHIDFKPALPEASAMSVWAYKEVVAAIEEDLVPNYLQNLYLNNITRDEFCDLVIQAISEVLDQDIEDVVFNGTDRELSAWQKDYPFVDSSSSNVIAAYALGIVNGRGEGIFDPYMTITRQEAAAFLMRSAKVLGMDTTGVPNAGFVDGDSVGVWFKDAVNFVYQINVMNGTSQTQTQFSPLGQYTREQSFMTIYRLFKAVTGA